MNTNNPVIRPLNFDDLSSLNTHFPQPHSGAHRVRLEHQAKGKESYNCVDIDGTIAAIQLIRWSGSNNPKHQVLSQYPEIGSVYVLPQFRQQGLAKALLKNSERLIKEKGHQGAGLVIKDENEISINLHIKAGYKAVGAASPTKQDPDKPRTYYTKQL